MDLNLSRESLLIIDCLRISTERDLGIPVSVDDVVNCIISSYFKLLVGVDGGDE